MNTELTDVVETGPVRKRLRAYRSADGQVSSIAVEEAGVIIRQRLASPAIEPGQQLVWLDIMGPGEEEGAFLHGLGIHQLAVEDCLRGRQRPKVDRFGSHLLVVSYAAHINIDRNRVAFTELHLLVGAGFLISVHDHSIPEIRAVMARWRGTAGLFSESGKLAHAVIDEVIDNYFPILEHFSVRVAELETEIFEADRQTAMQDILGLRRELVLFRRVVGPERDMLGDLVRRDVPFFNPELLPYFMDVRDHVMRIAEELDVMRDLLAASLEGHLALSSNQLNVTMRMMTAWSIILMTMAVIAGVYGMNFHFMPELGWKLGYAFALVLMLSIGGALVLFFRRRGWI